MADEVILSHGDHSAEDLTIFTQVLRRYRVDLRGVIIEQPPHAHGFSGAIIRRVQVAKPAFSDTFSRSLPAAFCLRGWPRHGLPTARIVELHRFLHFIRDQEICVLPVPLAASDCETLIAHDGRSWQLEPWMPGKADFAREPSEKRLQVTMQLLAQLHRVAARYRPTARGCEWFAVRESAPSPAVGERLVMVDRWPHDRIRQAARCMVRDPDARLGDLAGEIVDRFGTVRSRLKVQLQQMMDRPVPLQPCLRDVWHDHVLFTGDEVTGLIDAAATRTESVAADLSRLLGSFLGKRSEAWERAIDAYCAVRPLSQNETALIDVLHRSGVLLSGMTWVERRMNAEISVDLLPKVVARLEGIRSQL